MSDLTVGVLYGGLAALAWPLLVWLGWCAWRLVGALRRRLATRRQAARAWQMVRQEG